MAECDKRQLDSVQHSVLKDDPQDEDDLSHMEVIVKVQEHIKNLMKDPFLSDLPSGVSLDKVQSQLALEEGRAITVNIRRYDDIVIPVIVLQGATVNDLIIAFQKEMIRRCANESKTTYISWRYVWRTYWLLYQQQKLRNRDAKLTSYGITNNDELTFVKKLKNEEYPSTRRQHYQSRGRGRKMTRSLVSMYSAGPEPSLWRSQKANNLLLKGAANGDVEIVKRAISEGADINVHDSFNNFQRTPLHWAAFKGHLNVMSEVITQGADIESTNDDKSTPLHLAAAYDHPEACKFLVCSGANPNAVDVLGRTPLHRAAMRGHTRIASYLISQGAHVNTINNKGDTPLHDACYAGDVNFVDLLLSKGADPSIQNNRGRLSVDNVSYNRDAILQLVRNKQTSSQGYGSPPPILSLILGVQPSTPQDSHQNRRVYHLLEAKKSQPLLPDREVQVEAKKSQSLLHKREVWGLTQQLQGLQPPTLQQDLQEDLKSRDREILDLTRKLEAINDQVQEKDRQIQDLTLQKDREIQRLTQQLKISYAIVQTTNALQQELQKKDNEIQRLTQELHATNSQVQDKEREMQRRDIDYNLHLQETTTALQQAQQNIQQLQEAAIQQRQDQEDSHWVVNRDEIHVTEQVIGRGAYGEVKVAHFRGLKVAAKHMHQIILSPYYSSIFAREMKMAACVRHPNLLQFIGAVQEGVRVILTEWMSTSLRKELEKSPLTRPQIIKICTDIALALNYLHLWKPHPILHRDVSSQNVLLECCGTGARQWKAKLSDYGLANFVHQISVNSGPGCPAYSAPEAPYSDHHSPAMDVYSFGILLIEMILCQPPPPTTAEKERLVLLIRWQSLQHLVQRCIVNDPRSRLTCAQILTELDNL